MIVELKLMIPYKFEYLLIKQYNIIGEEGKISILKAHVKN